jgi:catechol 2,3-dioxygenase-like lactoylglutathione lyase family enzyme
MPNLASASLVAFVPILNKELDKEKATDFYVGKLGLTLVADQSPFALVLDAHGTTIRATFVPEFTPHVFTVLGWRVPDIAAYVTDLTAAGVSFNRYPWLNLAEGALPIWTAPGGTQIAWFTDPFGNVLSLQQDV